MFNSIFILGTNCQGRIYMNRQWKRNCPECNKEITYTQKYSRDDAEQKNRKCQKCGCGWSKGLTKDTSPSLMGMSKKVSKAMVEYRKTAPPWNKGLTRETNEILAKMGDNHKGFVHTENTKKLISKASIEHWKDTEYREKVIKNATIGIRKAYAEGRVKYPINRDTKPELAVMGVLDDMEIKYIKQYPIWSSYPRTEKTVRFYDFYLTDYNKIIEVHGDYWHANPTKYLDRNNLSQIQKETVVNDADKVKRAMDVGKEVFVIWEEHTKDKEVLYEKISYILQTTNKLAT